MGLRNVLIKLGLLPPVDEPVRPPQRPDPPLPTLEVFSQPGHGKSSYLWSVCYMLRKLNLVWPDYLCWPQDDATEEALKAIHESVYEGRLPPRGAKGNELRYDLLLRNMERWGEKRLVVWDWPDPVFSSSDSNGSRKERINWGAPACWLLSLPDLRDVQVEYLDMVFDDLVRNRIRQGHPMYSRPFRLVVVLTKGDAVPDLPLPIRDYLKQDPLWKAVSWEEPGSSPLLGAEPLRAYLATLSNAHARIQQWLDGTLHGHMLLRRAAEYHVQLRFSIISATGSGLVEGGKLQLPWMPRRVLDPLFWAMELDSTPFR